MAALPGVCVFSFFEKLVQPYPQEEPKPQAATFFAFIWGSTQGLRPYLAALTALTATIGAFEALLYGVLSRVVDWLSKVQPQLLWQQERGSLLLLAAILLCRRSVKPSCRASVQCLRRLPEPWPPRP